MKRSRKRGAEGLDLPVGDVAEEFERQVKVGRRQPTHPHNLRFETINRLANLVDDFGIELNGNESANHGT